MAARRGCSTRSSRTTASSSRYVDTADPENVRRAFAPRTRLVHIETPTNPLMQLTDIRAVRAVCHAGSEWRDVSVDNTFMSPYFQRPIELGADMVMHSTTKFLNGHSRRNGRRARRHQAGARGAF